MDLIEIDVVGAQPTQALLTRRHDPPARVSLSIRVTPHGTMHLGGQNDLFPLGLRQCLSDDLFGLTRGVDVGGIDKVDAGIESPVNDADRLVVIRGPPGPEHHGPEAEWAYFDTGATKSTKFHGPIVAAYPVRGTRCCVPRAGYSVLRAPCGLLGHGTAARSSPASQSAKPGPARRTPGVGSRAPLRIALPARPGTRTGSTTTRWPRRATTDRARSTRSAGSGPATSTISCPGNPAATSRSTSPTVRAAIGWTLMRGTMAIGPMRVRPSIWAGNSWNWVARTMVAGSGPSSAAAS